MEADELFIEVRDGGVGFNPPSVRAHTTSGLRGMQERARLLGGQLRIESSYGRGTRVVARLPVGPATGMPQYVGAGVGE